MEITLEQMVASIYADLRDFAEELEAGYDVGLVLTPARIEVETRVSRDPSRSSNGGEYDFWTVYTKSGSRVYRLEKASCDFWQPMDEPEVCHL